jgi:hypothetical protein
MVISASPAPPGPARRVRQAHLRAVLHPGGKFQVDGLAIGQRDPLVRTVAASVRARAGGSAHRRGAAAARAAPFAKAAGARTARTPALPNNAFKDITEIHAFLCEAAEILAGSRPGPRRDGHRAVEAPAHAAKWAGRVAVAVDLAPVEPGALVGVRQQS